MPAKKEPQEGNITIGHVLEVGSSQRLLGRGREVHVEWAELAESFGGVGKKRKKTNLSCDFVKKEEKKRQQRGCVLPSEGPPPKGEGELHMSIWLAEAWECRGEFVPERARSWGRASEPETSVAPCWFPIPQPPEEGKGSLSTTGLFSVPCGAGLMPATQPQSYLPFQEPQEAAQMNPLSRGRSQQVSL